MWLLSGINFFRCLVLKRDFVVVSLYSCSLRHVPNILTFRGEEGDGSNEALC
jgi:hypothetical protein